MLNKYFYAIKHSILIIELTVASNFGTREKGISDIQYLKK